MVNAQGSPLQKNIVEENKKPSFAFGIQSMQNAPRKFLYFKPTEKKVAAIMGTV